MSLRKKHSANLGASIRQSSESPGSKSDQGGGVRLNVSLEDLHLDDSPTTITPKQALHSFNGRISHDARDITAIRDGVPQAAFVQQLHGVNDLQDGTAFQLSSLAAEDGDVFTSPSRGQRHPSPPAPSSGPTKQGPTPTLAPPAFNLKKQQSTSALDSAYSSNMQGVIPSMQPVAVQCRSSNTGARTRVGNVDAQAFYPATACVFVANLPDCVRDSRLEAELTRVFSQYGIVFVKIRRDQRNMPFAFCQFTKEEDAHTAVMQARGTLIEGRPCRTEMVKANRSFVIFHFRGEDVTIDEARVQMAGFGRIEACEVLPPSIQDAMRIRSGVLVKYDSFDPSRDVIAAYRQHPKYRVMAYDLKKITGPKVDRDEQWLKQYDIDRRTVFVGNLPAGEQNLEELLRSLIKDIGEVFEVKVVHKDPQPGRPYAVAYGFVEFCRPDLADVAVQALHGRDLCGCRLRVERKNCRDPRSIRRRQQGVAYSRHTNVANTPLANAPTRDRGAETQQQLETSSQASGQETPGVSKPATEPATPLSHHSQQTSANTLSASASRTAAIASGSLRASRPRTASCAFMPPAGQNYDGDSAAYDQSEGTPSQFRGTPGQFQGTPARFFNQYQGTPSQFQGTPFQGNTQVGAGVFPATPQGTPGLASPFSPYYASSPFAWLTPYLQGPTYYQAYSSPSGSVAPSTADDVCATPIQCDTGTIGRGGSGGSQGQGQEG
ncbi:hypothetical protein F5Y05DRAFT_410851 [Hypoxylon sp. FL0543]|nr:hypothetical protein F5Y05DRAFT_410851 [Hypoxylon sp. FL0543]